MGGSGSRAQRGRRAGGDNGDRFSGRRTPWRLGFRAWPAYRARRDIPVAGFRIESDIVLRQRASAGLGQFEGGDLGVGLDVDLSGEEA